MGAQGSPLLTVEAPSPETPRQTIPQTKAQLPCSIVQAIPSAVLCFPSRDQPMSVVCGQQLRGCVGVPDQRERERGGGSTMTRVLISVEKWGHLEVLGVNQRGFLLLSASIKAISCSLTFFKSIVCVGSLEIMFLRFQGKKTRKNTDSNSNHLHRAINEVHSEISPFAAMKIAALQY